jgi:hypothetical protein
MMWLCTNHTQYDSVHHNHHHYCQKLNSLETHKTLIMTQLNFVGALHCSIIKQYLVS